MTGSPETPAPPLALPAYTAGSGTIDRLVDTARGYADHAVSESTRRTYTRDWAAFARWCRKRGADPLPPSPELIGLYITDLAGPSGKTRSLSVASIECRIAGLTWGYVQRGLRLDRRDRHIVSVLAGIRRRHARPPCKRTRLGSTSCGRCSPRSATA